MKKTFTLPHGARGNGTKTVSTIPNPRTRHTSAHVIFTRVNRNLCVSKKQSFFTSSTGCRTRPRCCFLHTWALPHFPSALQSDLPADHLPDLRCCPLHMEIHPVRIHRMCLSASCTRLQVFEPNDLTEMNNTQVTPMIFHRPSMTATYDSAERVATLPPESIWMMNNYGICWLHRCTYRRERSRCRPITSLSLLQRKLSVKFISLPRKCRETSRSILTRKKVESRDTFRQRRHFLRTSTSSRKRRSSIQTLWIRTCCETSTRRTKRSSVRRGKNGSIETRVWSRLSWLFYSWTWKTNSCQSYGDWSKTISNMKLLEESRPDSTKNWHSEKEHFGKLVLEIFTRWKNWKELRTNAPGKNWEKVMRLYKNSLHKYRSCRIEGTLWTILLNSKM